MELRTINPTMELVLKHKKANMRKSDFLMLEALKSAPHLNDNICSADRKMVIFYVYLHNISQEITILAQIRR